jgi:hypothetical protein
VPQDEHGPFVSTVTPNVALGQHEEAVALLPQGSCRVVEQCCVSTNFRVRLDFDDGRRAAIVNNREVGRIEAPFRQLEPKRLMP